MLQRLLGGFRDSVALYFDTQGVWKSILTAFLAGENPNDPNVETTGIQVCQSLIREVIREIDRLRKDAAKRQAEHVFIKNEIKANDDRNITTVLLELQAADIKYYASNLTRKRDQQFASRALKGGRSSSGSGKQKKSKKEAKNGNGTEEKGNADESNLGEVMLVANNLGHNQYVHMSKVQHELNRNATTEPYLQGNWNKAPYPKRPYEELKEYVPTDGPRRSSAARFNAHTADFEATRVRLIR